MDMGAGPIVLAVLLLLIGFVVWLLFVAIQKGLKQAAQVPDIQRESLLAAESAPSAPVPVPAGGVSVPRWEREVRAILEQEEEGDASDTDRCDWYQS